MTLQVPARILVIGGGGREHALAWKLAREAGVDEVIVAPGSAGIAQEPQVRCVHVDPLDQAAVVALARSEAVDLVVVGPEAPLAAGVADALAAGGVAVFGPSRAAARLETSKAFCHEVAEAAGVVGPHARAFTPSQREEAVAFLEELAADGRLAVLKADGLAAGKGVIVTDSLEQALDLLPSFLDGRPAGEPALVIQARLTGDEASVIALCDGERAIALPAARDHKRLCDGDRGPNTGGMGAYSPLPDVDDDYVARVLDEVHRPVLRELARRGTPFRGFLYAGLLIDERGVPALLEFNVRLGDPEAQVILPRLAVDIAPLLLAAARGSLPDTSGSLVPSVRDAAVGVVLAAEGYPGDPRKGDPIDGIDDAIASGAIVFHAGTVARPTPPGGWGTNGGRVLAVVASGPDLAAARAQAEAAADRIRWDGLQRRRDIAAVIPSPVLVPVLGGPATAATGARR